MTIQSNIIMEMGITIYVKVILYIKVKLDDVRPEFRGEIDDLRPWLREKLPEAYHIGGPHSAYKVDYQDEDETDYGDDGESSTEEEVDGDPREAIIVISKRIYHSYKYRDINDAEPLNVTHVAETYGKYINNVVVKTQISLEVD